LFNCDPCDNLCYLGHTKNDDDDDDDDDDKCDKSLSVQSSIA